VFAPPGTRLMRRSHLPTNRVGTPARQKFCRIDPLAGQIRVNC